MFGFKSKDTVEKDELKHDVERLEKEKRALKEQLEEEDIKHMVKINSERKEIELEKEKVKLEREKASEIATVKDEYRDKLEARLQTEVVNIKEMYGEILTRLPNINVEMKRK